MNVSRILLIATFTSACGDTGATQRATPPPATPAEVAIKEGERKTSTDPAVNPNAAAMAEFKARVDKYADLHKQLAKGAATQKETSDPAQINAAKTALAAKVQAARAGAKQGDIFTAGNPPRVPSSPRARAEGRRGS